MPGENQDKPAAQQPENKPEPAANPFHQVQMTMFRLSLYHAVMQAQSKRQHAEQ